MASLNNGIPPSADENNNANVKLLAVLSDPSDADDAEDSMYRFLVDGRDVKYVTAAANVTPADDRGFAPILIPSLPTFPPGNWNEGHIVRDSNTGEPVFERTVYNDSLAGVENAWHPLRIDHLELQTVPDGRILQNMHRVTHPTLFDGKVVIRKCAEFPWQMRYYQAETDAYRWLRDTDIGPRFLGHVTEAGRVIGFIVECIEHARTAGPGDFEACHRALAQLHALGIRHGDINRYNFLILKDKEDTAVLIDFECARKGCSADELQAEMDKLAYELSDETGRGGTHRVTRVVKEA
ncbi:hypothetical protein SEUCBS139899_008353 [Sporothrix eucalyptigena]